MTVVQCPHCQREFWDQLIFDGGPCPRCHRLVDRWGTPRIAPPPDPDPDDGDE